MSPDRREFIGPAVSTFVAARFGMVASRSDFGPVRQIDAGVLSVGYAESGPANGPAVILLHGWPDDIYSFADVTPLLAAKG